MHLSRRALVTLGVLGGSFLAAIEATIVATAMPTVVEHFGGLGQYSWVFAAYMLTSTVTVPLWGKLADLYGRRRFYLAAIALFVAGSALSGAAQSMGQLIGFRAVQGLGAGGLIPLGMTILGDLYTLRERARMQGVFSSVWGIASIIGPLSGGYITETLSWRWVFYLNLPFGALAGGLVGWGLVEPALGRRPRIDYRGAILMVASLTTLLVALEQSGTPGRGLPVIWLVALYGASLGLGAWFLRTERRAAEPLLPLELFANRLIAAASACGFFVGLAMFGAITFVPLFVQAALGGSATRAGTALTPILLGWVLMSIVVGRVLPRVGFRPLLLVGLSVQSVGFLILMGVGRDSHPLQLLGALALMGMGMGMTMLTLLLALQNAVDRDRLGVATSLSRFLPSIGGAVGVAIMGAIVAASVPVGGTPGSLDMERALQRAFGAGLVAVLASLAAAWQVPRGLPAAAPDPAPTASVPGAPTTGRLSETPKGAAVIEDCIAETRRV